MNLDDHELWLLANAILNDSKISLKINPHNMWLSIQGGVFVTGYRDLPPSNENVNCCMSNGRYQSGSVAENLIESAH